MTALMRNSGVLCVVACIAFIGISCGEAEQFSQSALVNCWAHAQEEQLQEASAVYRPCDYQTFQPSRYRNTFTLNSDKSATFSVLSPNDAHYSASGTWTFDAKSNALQILNSANEVVRQYTVTEVAADLLLLQ